MEQEKKLLHWVRGNILRLAIPLEQEIITEEQTTREDYIVQSDDVVTVNLVSSSRRYIYAPKSIEGNVVSIEDNGELDLGTYGVEVLLSKADGTRLRSFWNYLIKIHNTNDAVLEEWDEFADVSGEILDSAIFFFAKGDPFTYEDFTQEQLDDIKRPALEAANVATQAAQNANAAATNANNAKNATIIATNLANSATQNANDAASSANSAAISANQSKRLADIATNKANNAADAATQAAEIATESANNADIATDKTNDAIAQAQRAAVIGSNPDFIGSDYYVYKYNARLGRYERSNIYVRGENGDKGEKGDKGDKGDAGTTDYNLLENKPTRVSQFDNDADYATESFVNSSIATATATYRGSYNLVTDLGLSVGASAADVSAALATSIPDADNNDYCFVQVPVATDTPTVIARIDRYKHNGSGWLYEYTLNNSGFTAEQWDAINSGITSGDVDKLDALPTNAQLTSLLNGKQDVINDLASIRSGASAGATAYQKPVGGIPESDLSQGVKDKMNEKDVFWATYGTTTAAEIDAAVAAGKLPIVVYNGKLYVYSNNTTTNVLFTNTYLGQLHRVQIDKATGTWDNSYIQVEQQSNRRSSWQATPDNNHYPSEKLVKDSLDAKADLSSMSKWGVVSQTLNVIIVRDPVVQTSNLGYNIEATDPVEGWIPQANIDLFENAGAVFNSSTGYFELNGITNIAYDEMQRIYTTGDIWRYYTSGDMNISSQYDIGIYRTVFPTSCFKTITTNFIRSTFDLEVIKFSRTPFVYTNNGSISYAFYNNVNALKKVLDRIDCQANTAFNLDNCFTGCPLLETIYINKLQKNIGFKLNYKLSYETVSYMVSHATNTSAITITVHPTIYGYLTGTIQPPEETGGTSAEWQQIVTDATAKNISFASA